MSRIFCKLISYCLSGVFVKKKIKFWSQADNVSSIQRKTYGLALSIILTLRLPQVLNKLDQILRYEFHHEFGQSSLFWLLDDLYKMLLIYTCSVCTTVILGGNDDLTEESRLDPLWFYFDLLAHIKQLYFS